MPNQPPEQPKVGLPQSTGAMTIYDNFKWPNDIPKKPFSELTEDQRRRLKAAYRFSGFFPGVYQAITGNRWNNE